MKVSLKAAIQIRNQAQAEAKNARAIVKDQNYIIKTLRENLKTERALSRIVREDAKRIATERRAEKSAARIAKMESKLIVMKAKQARKNGPVKVFTAEEIAELMAL